MSEISIKVSVGGRSYPLTIDASEESLIREAEKQLEESIALFQKNYAVKDKQDLLAMAALQLASRRITQTPPAEKEIIIEKVIERVEVPADASPLLKPLETLVDSYLS